MIKMSKTGTREAFRKKVELNIIEYLREYADAAEASGSGHWAVAMREAVRQLRCGIEDAAKGNGRAEEDFLKLLATDLGVASQHLRSAWKTMKHNGMEETATQLADVVLDIETAAEQVNAALVANAEITGSALLRSPS